MSTMISMHQAERTKLRRFPFLPRIGFVVDVGGRRFTLRHVPLLETVLNLKERGLSLKNLRKLVRDELNEIRFPLEGGLTAVSPFKKSSVEPAKVVKKAAPRAAASKKATEA